MQVKFIRLLFVLIGSGLLIINIVGILVSPAVPVKNAQGVVELIPGYDYSIRVPDVLLAVLSGPDETFTLKTVNTLIYQTLRHSPDRKILWYENWLWWLVGYVSGGDQRTQNPERLILGGAALCGEAAMVMNSIAEHFGFATRLIGLTGHVVSEVKTKNGWRVADPDYGVTYQVDLKTLEGTAGPAIMHRALHAKGYDNEFIEQYVALFQTTADNRCNASSVALSPRLYWAEKVSGYLKWIIPVLLLGLYFRQD